ncbi:MAG: SWIM zinc finger family protein [Thermoplasmatota archaeon]
MARWGSSWDAPYPKASPRPVKGGLRIEAATGPIGKEWWSRAWVAALERFASSSRLGRGRAYARRGQVAKLEIGQGGVRAVVQGSRPEPYEVTIRLKPISATGWRQIDAALAEKASFAAALLGGDVPHDIETVFADAHQPLLPKDAEDLATDCSCPDWENPCKHVAAVHYLLGEALDKDPFLLFALRGRSRDEILGALRKRRKAATPDIPPEERPPALRDVGKRTEPRGFWNVPESFRGIEVRFPAATLRSSRSNGRRTGRAEPPAVLQAAGYPAVWGATPELRATLNAIYEAATEYAWRIAYSTAGAPIAAGLGDAPVVSPSGRRSESELRDPLRHPAPMPASGGDPRRQAQRPPMSAPSPAGTVSPAPARPRIPLPSPSPVPAATSLRPVPGNSRLVHSSGRIMVNGRWWDVGPEHRGERVDVEEDSNGALFVSCRHAKRFAIGPAASKPRRREP